MVTITVGHGEREAVLLTGEVDSDGRLSAAATMPLRGLRAGQVRVVAVSGPHVVTNRRIVIPQR
ncbi:MAG: hypothetical protein ABR606_01895 [Vicinamibacterales bacterium]